MTSMFIYDPLVDTISTESETIVEVGALTSMRIICDRTYEDNLKWYFVVFKPFNKPYLKDPDWFAVKGLDNCRQHFKKPSAYILTREIEAEKIHINALVCTSTPPIHDSVYNNKYKLHVKLLLTIIDRQSVLTYITKEFHNKTPLRYLDYLHSK